MAKFATRRGSAEHLQTVAEVTAYLDASAEGGDPAQMMQALGDVARTRNASRVARDAGMTPGGLVKAFSGKGNPSFKTIVRLARGMGLRLRFEAMEAGGDPEHRFGEGDPVPMAPVDGG